MLYATKLKVQNKLIEDSFYTIWDGYIHRYVWPECFRIAILLHILKNDNPAPVDTYVLFGLRK